MQRRLGSVLLRSEFARSLEAAGIIKVDTEIDSPVGDDLEERKLKVQLELGDNNSGGVS